MKRQNEREEKLNQFYTLLVKESKIRRMRKDADTYYAFNECGQSVLLIETIMARVLQFLSLESLFTLCGVSRKLGETLATLVKRYPLESISCHSTKTLERLDFFWHQCFTAPLMLKDILKSVHTVRLRVRHNPFVTKEEKDAWESERLRNGYKRSDILLETNIKTLLIEAVEDADLSFFFGRFRLNQKKAILYCVTDPIKYYGREWSKFSVPDIPTTIITDFRGLKYASLQNMTIKEG